MKKHPQHLFLSLVVGGLLTVYSVSAQEAPFTLANEVTVEIELSSSAPAMLSPDGTQFAVFGFSEICLYAVSFSEMLEPAFCASLPESRRFAPESIRWAPDSSALVFTESSLRFAIDGDIWLLDVTTQQIHNLTEDEDENREQTSGFNFNFSETYPLDIAPSWSADSQSVLFVRYTGGTEMITADLMSIDRTGENLQVLQELSVLQGFRTHLIAASTDGIHVAYNTWFEEDYGLYVSELDGSDITALFDEADRNFSVNFFDFSPTGDQLRVSFSNALMSRGFRTNDMSEQSPVQVISLGTGERALIDPEKVVWNFAWSPDGSSLAYLATDSENNTGVYITDAVGTPGQLVWQGDVSRIYTALYPLTWGENHTLMFSRIESGDGYTDLTVTILELAPTN